MVDYFGLGVLTPGMGIFHLVFSYSGKLTLSVLADRDIMSDPEFYHDCLVASYEELYAAAINMGTLRAKSTDIAAKAKIKSPRRKRASTATRKSRPKNASIQKKTVKKAKPIAKKPLTAKAPRGTKAAAKKKVAARPSIRAAATRPKVTRRESGSPKPKLV